MIMAKKKKEEVQETIEKKLWKAADKLRKNIDADDLKIFVSIISNQKGLFYNCIKR